MTKHIRMYVYTHTDTYMYICKYIYIYIYIYTYINIGSPVMTRCEARPGHVWFGPGSSAQHHLGFLSTRELASAKVGPAAGGAPSSIALCWFVITIVS